MKKAILMLLVLAVIGTSPVLAADVVRVGNLKFAHYGAVWYMKEIASKYNLEIQERVNAENRTFSTLSNVLKAEHDTVKTAIGNIR